MRRFERLVDGFIVAAAMIAICAGTVWAMDAVLRQEPGDPPPERAARLDDPELFAARHEVSGPVNPEDETGSERLVYVGKFRVTGYDLCADCCGDSDGLTSSGTVATVGRTAAVGRGVMEYGTRVWIPGIGDRVIEDRGGLGPAEIDVLCADHKECREITGEYDVFVVETGK